MKTSVIEVRDMLSVLSVLGVEKRMGEVPGVESVTVNYAAGNATVRYDETRLEIADIRSAVRQGGYESDAAATASGGNGHKSHTAPDASPATPPIAAPKAPPVGLAAAAPASETTPAAKPSTPAAAAPKPPSGAPAMASTAQPNKAGPSTAPKPSPAAPAAAVQAHRDQ